MTKGLPRVGPRLGQGVAKAWAKARPRGCHGLDTKPRGLAQRLGKGCVKAPEVIGNALPRPRVAVCGRRNPMVGSMNTTFQSDYATRNCVGTQLFKEIMEPQKK